MKTLRVLSLLLTSGFFFVACGDDAPQEVIIPFSDMGVAGCGSSAECLAGQVCIGGRCVGGQCAPDRPCGQGEVCNPTTRTCDPVNQGCSNNTDCMQGFCVAGSCRNVECVEDANCGANQTCVNNNCMDRPRDCVDNDGDGFGVGADCTRPDCDDNDPNVNPNVIEDSQVLCGDGIDHNCDNIDPMCASNDNDNDGFTEERGDCDDNDPTVNPMQQEIPYNGKDDDCKAETSDTDVDRDGYDAEEVGGEDCNDSDPTISPEGRDIPNNGIDEDCDGMDRVPGNMDRDGDGVTEAAGDCNDDDPAINPNAVEVAYNGIDDDCDVNTPDNDLDGDGSLVPEDCDDNDPNRSPINEEEYYNGVDDDCNDETRDADADSDGFDGGDNGPDCNDRSAVVNPNAEEVPYNGEDDDCNPATPDDDLDGDGVTLGAGDCNDNDPGINPNIVEDAENNCSDMVDNDCRGGDVECVEGPVADADMDGIPDDQDCEPNNAAIPGPVEIPNNGLDDDCNPNTLDDCEDDAFDLAAPNNTPETATPVEDGETYFVQYGALRLCGDDFDVYSIDIQQGDGLEVDLTFNGDEADIDMRLFRDLGDGDLQLIDQSLSLNDYETVWLPRADADGRYLIQVFRFAPGNQVSYGMTVNVMNQCTDDLLDEQNDRQETALELPIPGETRQACEYDADWYTFELQRRENVRIDLLFTHADGDMDLQLFDSAGEIIDSATSISDNETIEVELDRGTYGIRVFPFAGAQNNYRIFRGNGIIGSDEQRESDNVAIPDALEDGTPGRIEVDMTFNVPAGSVVRELVIRDLNIDHGFLRDLRVSGQWDGQELAVFWNRQGDNNGRDGGEDDDFLPLTGDDINFDNRRYQAFAGQPATGTFTLVIEDLANRFDGRLDNIEVELFYFSP